MTLTAPLLMLDPCYMLLATILGHQLRITEVTFLIYNNFRIHFRGVNNTPIYISYCSFLVPDIIGAMKKGPANKEQNWENQEQNGGKKLQNWAFFGVWKFIKMPVVRPSLNHKEQNFFSPPPLKQLNCTYARYAA